MFLLAIATAIMASTMKGSDASDLPRQLRNHGRGSSQRDLRAGAFFCGEQYSYVGCFNDYPSDRSGIKYGAPFTYYQCAKACKDAGYDYMGRQYTEECFCGNGDPTNATGLFKYGETTGCNCNPNTQNIGLYKFCAYDLTESEDKAATLEALQDTEIRQESPGTTYGSMETLATSKQTSCTGLTRRSLIEFDLTNIDFDPSCATLRLYVPNTSGGVRAWIDIYRINIADTTDLANAVPKDLPFYWEESSLTWMSTYLRYPPLKMVLGNTQLFVKQQNDRYQFVEVDVSDLVNGQVGNKVTLLLMTDRFENNVGIGCNTIEFSSKDDVDNEGPKLIITGTSPSSPPSQSPSKEPTNEPTSTPTKAPTSPPTDAPTKQPTDTPTHLRRTSHRRHRLMDRHINRRMIHHHHHLSGHR